MMVCGWMKQGQYYIFTINFFMSKFTVKQSKNRSNKTKQKKILKTERETMVELSDQTVLSKIHLPRQQNKVEGKEKGERTKDIKKDKETTTEKKKQEHETLSVKSNSGIHSALRVAAGCLGSTLLVAYRPLGGPGSSVGTRLHRQPWNFEERTQIRNLVSVGQEKERKKKTQMESLVTSNRAAVPNLFYAKHMEEKSPRLIFE